MATYDRSERVTRRIQYTVPAGEPWGACWVEVQKAIAAVTIELRDFGLVKPDREPTDDQIRILPGDGSVIVFYEVTERE